MAIYRKALVLSNDEKTERGDIVNLMSVDATRMQDLCTYLLMAFSGPFQVSCTHCHHGIVPFESNDI